MLVSYSENKKFAYVDGYKFTRDEHTGYYLSSRLIGQHRKRLHVFVWELFNGTVSADCHVHHLDEDKSNNEIENLCVLSPSEHVKAHDSAERRATSSYNLNGKARPKAIEWHKSSEGRAWHKEHYEYVKEELHKRKTFECKMCGKEFQSTRPGFCCNSCKSAWRRRSGKDNEERGCIVCGRKFVTNKYSKTRTCSISCSHKICKNKIN